MLVEALSKMKTKKFYCIIAGADQGRTAYVNEIKELAKKYRLKNKVGFYGIASDVPAAMMVSNIVLSTAREPEAFGRMTIEGQAMGKIVIASNIGGSLETIEDGITGKLFESDNAQSLADALDWALTLPEQEKNKISAAAIKNANNNFTRQIMCDKTIKVYYELLKK